MKSEYSYEQAASMIGTKKEVMEMAAECGCDDWAVVELSARKFGLFTGESLNIIPFKNVIFATGRH